MTTLNLIIQSPALAVEHAEQLAALASAQGIARISTTAARLLDVQADEATRAEVRAWAERHGIDAAFVSAGLRLADCKVLAMDMDSTLINIECIDEIAAMAGLGDKVAQITEAAMRGEIKDFSESLRRRVALLKGVPASTLQRVYDEKLLLNPGAERMLSSVQAAGIKTLLVSGGFTFFTERLKARLGLDRCFANTLDVDADGKLTGSVLGDIVDGAAKARHLQAFAQEHGAATAQIIAMGDGANDLPMLSHAGFPVAYHAKPIVREQTRYALNVTGLDGILNWFEA
ncbi:phosphoserine phosphatase SerB [Bordetella genomosp. 1]|uniref:Phosphoserine phosphatase n=1 Tax=Bordetella genomosp. 1 TaxID=1395607 RepID=A0A261SQS7_9BORD|nr:phosphoserine phosphatase SerB [Bordetella genomosp. 1]OZI39190.1 phosphoserine phosphatase SerB [Bordetella genomosp. 1]